MERKCLLDQPLLEVMLTRICLQLLEGASGGSPLCLIGLQPRGAVPAQRMAQKLAQLSGQTIPLGHLDSTFHRDDFGRRTEPLKASQTQINFPIENRRIILVDDVLYTGRSVRAALDALGSFGRPAQVELAVIVDRRLTRQLPVQANYTGVAIDTVTNQRVVVEWRENGHSEDKIWLIS